MCAKGTDFVRVLVAVVLAVLDPVLDTVVLGDAVGVEVGVEVRVLESDVVRVDVADMLADVVCVDDRVLQEKKHGRQVVGLLWLDA